MDLVEVECCCRVTACGDTCGDTRIRLLARPSVPFWNWVERERGRVEAQIGERLFRDEGRMALILPGGVSLPFFLGEGVLLKESGGGWSNERT